MKPTVLVPGWKFWNLEVMLPWSITRHYSVTVWICVVGTHRDIIICSVLVMTSTHVKDRTDTFPNLHTKSFLGNCLKDLFKASHSNNFYWILHLHISVSMILIDIQGQSNGKIIITFLTSFYPSKFRLYMIVTYNTFFIWSSKWSHKHPFKATDRNV